MKGLTVFTLCITVSGVYMFPPHHRPHKHHEKLIKNPDSSEPYLPHLYQGLPLQNFPQFYNDSKPSNKVPHTDKSTEPKWFQNSTSLDIQLKKDFDGPRDPEEDEDKNGEQGGPQNSEQNAGQDGEQEQDDEQDSEQDREENDQSPFSNTSSGNITGPLTGAFSYHNLVDVQDNGCPSGHEKDPNGKCQKIETDDES